MGVHESGLIGEDPTGTLSNLMPYMAQVAAGKFMHINVFGNDYLTPDGTGVRDYIHVMDLAEGHLSALNFLSTETGWHAINLGTGKGYSVLDMVKAFENVSGRHVPYRIGMRRSGDSARSWADATLAQRLMGWKATRSLDQMCVDAWRWQQRSMP